MAHRPSTLPAKLLATCVVAAGALVPSAAAAQVEGAVSNHAGSSGEGWLLTAEAIGGALVGKPQASLFGPGGSGSAGLYRSMNAHLLLGLRVRGAAFSNQSAEDVSRADPGLGGLGSLSLAARLRPLASGAEASRARGLWIEAAGGGGLTGDLFRPMVEAGLGWGLSAGPVIIGPAVRYLHVFQSGGGLDSADAKAVLVGIELTLLDRQPLPPAPPPPPSLPPPPPEPPAAPPPKDSDGDGILDADDKCPTEPEDKDGFEDTDGCPDGDNDKDGIADKDDACPDQAEVVNGVDDKDGCPDEGLITLVNDRVVLDEKLVFDTNRARISTRGKRALAAVVRLWKQHPEWERMEVEGHADGRGAEKYNQWLSEERAKRVVAMLVKLGIEAEKLTGRGLGKSRPQIEGRSPELLHQNRRVELVVIRKRPADPVTPVQPLAPPGLGSPEVAPPKLAPQGGTR